jgi:hypothetical protein
MKENKDFIEIITEYSNAYIKLENFQKKEENEKIIPKGDQKTGVIGEFLGLKILKKIYPESEVSLSTNHSQKGFDVKIKTNDSTEYIQIKTISEFSKKGISSKIKFEFDHDGKTQELSKILIILLDKNLLEGQYLLLENEYIKTLDKKKWSRAKTKGHKNINKFRFSEEGILFIK